MDRDALHELRCLVENDPADLAAALIDKGMENPILRRIKTAYDDLQQEIKDA